MQRESKGHWIFKRLVENVKWECQKEYIRWSNVLPRPICRLLTSHSNFGHLAPERNHNFNSTAYFDEAPDKAVVESPRIGKQKLCGA